MAEVTSPPPSVSSNPPGSPPPNCAICLGTCTNKCFSDSCMHQFCFKCLLEWSKIKAVCPLCKQPFTSIIHNVKSNNEYDEHFIEQTERVETPNYVDESEFFYLPPGPPPAIPVRNIQQMMRHFQFRTTFTVDPRGELAIQQMLFSHPLTPQYGFNSPAQRRYRRRDVSSSAFRRSIYSLNLWVHSPPDVTGRYRETDPEFYRLNPAAINRLVPWLNRELNALLEENTQQVMTLVDVILTHLREHHIRGRFFRNLLTEYFGAKTVHFIHEFYNFMKSTYDMIGYDRHVFYTRRPPIPIEIITDIDDSDSDVEVIEMDNNVVSSNSLQQPTIEVIEINSDTDSDVIIVNSEAETVEIQNQSGRETSEEEENRKPILPLKIRLKHKRLSKERRSKSKRKHKRDVSLVSSRSSSCSSSEDSSDSSTDCSYKRIKRKRKSKKSKRREPKTSKDHVKPSRRISYGDHGNSDDESLLSIQKKLRHSDSDDHIPLSKLKSREKKKKSRKEHKEKRSTKRVKSDPESLLPKLASTAVDNNSDAIIENVDSSAIYEQNTYYNPRFSPSIYPESHSSVDENNSKYNSSQSDVSTKPAVAVSEYYPGPSNSSGRIRSIVIKKENSNNAWYSRPHIYSTDSDDD